MRKILVLSLSAALVGVAVDRTEAQAQRRCSAAAIDQVLTDNAIPLERVTGRSFKRRESPGDDNDRVLGYDATVRLADFDGVLRIAFNRSCGVQRIFTRGPDQLPGIRATCA